jgi:Phage integrase family
VLQTMPSPFREMATLAALTLMRQGEIIALRREHVHLEQGVIMLPRAKAGARPVILSGEAQKILRGQLAAHESAWVFPGPSGAPYHRDYVGRTFRKAARAAGLRDFHFHDLRHHGATTALNRGFTAPIVMALGGWKTERMMRRYAAVTDQTLPAAAEAVSGNEPWQWSAKSPSIQPSSPPLQAEVAGSSPAPPTIVSVTRVSVTRAPESRRPLLHGAAGQSGRVNPTTASRPGRESPRLPG